MRRSRVPGRIWAWSVTTDSPKAIRNVRLLLLSCQGEHAGFACPGKAAARSRQWRNALLEKSRFSPLGTSRGILRCAQDDDSNGCQLADARSLTPALRLLAADQHHVGICVASNQGELSSIGRPVIVPDMLRFK